VDVDANANILRVTINDACINAFNDFRMSRGKTKFIIFKISDNRREIVIDEISQDPDYEVFRSKLEAARDAKDNPGPRYAVYDVEYELGGVEGKRYVAYLGNAARTKSVLNNPIIETRSSSSRGCPRMQPRL
jgi:cofilin/tropomyosin-type actin-binding protein